MSLPAALSSHRDDAARLSELTARVERVFTMIATVRMAGIPVLNPALGVALCGLETFGGHDVGVLVTPWFMNIMAFPLGAPEPVRVGTKRDLVLPSGAYEAIAGFEDELGPYWMVSLFSPMGAFETMEAALATAQAAMVEIMTAPEPEAPPPPPALPTRPISRRGLFGWARGDGDAGNGNNGEAAA